MVVKHSVEGYRNFVDMINTLEKNNATIYVLFCGTHEAENKSWCPDCVRAEPIVTEVVSRLPDSIHFVHVAVGNRTMWKDPACPFRTDKILSLKNIPTLIKWKGNIRLERDEDFNKGKLEVILKN